jgi:glucokinase
VSAEVVAVDLGQTKLLAARVTTGLEVAERTVVPSPLDSREELLEVLDERIRTHWSEDTVAVALACACTVDHRTGTLRWAGRLPLDGYPIQAYLETRFGVPVVVENDANAAAVGEHRAGAGVGVDNLVLLTIGTAVGGGLIVNGSLCRGFTGAAGEVGHFSVDSFGPRCVDGCRGLGHLDVIGSGTALDEAARAVGAADARALVELARAGDARARAAVAKVGRRLGRGVATLVSVLDPELVLLAGGAAAAGELLLDPIRRTVERLALPFAVAQPRIELAELGTNAELVGAAALAFDAAGVTA